MRVHRTYAEFAAILHARLGIGANGDGAKALRLLARIQAGNQVRSVDELYKEMVLERPATFAAADRAIEHFDDLESAYTAMRTEEQKHELLAPITGLHARKMAALAQAEELDAFGVTARGDTPVRLWLLRTHARLLGTAVEANRQGRARVADELQASSRAVTTLDADLEAAKEEHRAAGGASLERLAGDIERERVLREERLGRRTAAALDRADGAAGWTTTPSRRWGPASAFTALVDRAERWLAEHPAEAARLVAERDEVMGARYPLMARRKELAAERASLEGRAGRVPEHLHALRSEVARASGLSLAELPFVAELVDVAPEESRWRLAIETVLAGTARVMLVPLDRLEEFSTAIDSLRLRGRLTFEGAELDLDAPVRRRPRPRRRQAAVPGLAVPRLGAAARGRARAQRALRGVGRRPRRRRLPGHPGRPDPLGTPRVARPRRAAQHHRLQQRRRARRDRRGARPRSRSRSTGSTTGSSRSSAPPGCSTSAGCAYDAVRGHGFDDLDVAVLRRPDRRARAAPRRDPGARTTGSTPSSSRSRRLEARLEDARRHRFQLDEQQGAPRRRARRAGRGRGPRQRRARADRAVRAGRPRRGAGGPAGRGVRGRGRAGRPGGPGPVPRAARAASRPG